jgi:enoyl-CoA hydratase/carnithine racemase
VTVRYDADGPVVVVTIDRPEVRNAVDSETAVALRECFARFDADETLNVAVLTGAGGTFCAGYDLQELAASGGRPLPDPPPPAGEDFVGPMGPTRMLLGKPVIAAIEGYAVAGGLELALWCDLRVAAEDAILGVFNRRFGVPLIDLGTVRLPRMIGQGRALDLILSGRPVPAVEAYAIGLVERLAPPRTALAHAQALGLEIARHPQGALRADRRSVLTQWSLSLDEAMRAEHRAGVEVIASGESQAGAQRFAKGSGRHGKF